MEEEKNSEKIMKQIDNGERTINEARKYSDTSPYNIPGPGRIFDLNDLEILIQELSKQFGVDEQDIFIGRSEFPPETYTCLVYIELHVMGTYLVYFRKGIKPDGRWVRLSYMHHVFVDKNSEKAGTYDYRNNIAYVPLENLPQIKIGGD